MKLNCNVTAKGNRMPENLRTIVNMGNELPPHIMGVIMAMAMSVIRVMYDKEETTVSRVVLESMICGGLSLTASYGIMAMDWDLNWSIFLGGAIGYSGSIMVRQWAFKLVGNKLEK